MSKFTYTEVDAFWYLNLTDAQQTAYEHFYAKLKDLDAFVTGVDDQYTLLRFLKARQWDYEKAVAMYLKMTAWREEHKVDDIYESFEFPELDTVLPYYPHFYHKLDKFGRPIYVELVGKTDCNKLMHLTTEQRLIDYHVFTWERFHKQLAPACTELAGKPIVTTTVILDLKGLGIFNFTLTAQKLLSHLSHIDQDYYPESLGVMFIINTPFIFKTIWAFVYPMLEERTRKKIHVLGSDYMPYLAEVIDSDSLLTMFGGKSKAPDITVGATCSTGPWADSAVFNARRWLPVLPIRTQSEPILTGLPSDSSSVIEALEKTAASMSL